MHLGVRGGGVHGTVAQDIGNPFEIRSSLMRGGRPALTQDVRPSGRDATSIKGPPDDVAHPIRGQGAAERRPQIDKEQAMPNRRAASLEIRHQSARDTGGQG
jgi:hypothetical protein